MKPRAVDDGITESELHAYVDGCLDPERRHAVEAHLAANPDDAERVSAYRDQNIGLHKLLGGHVLETVPPRLHDLARELEEAAGHRRSARRIWAIAASVAAALAVSGTVLWQGATPRGEMGVDPVHAFTRQAARAHLAAMSGDAFGADADISDTARQTLPALAVPELAALGLVQLAERVLRTPDGPAVQVLFQDDRDNRITLYVSAWQGAGTASAALTLVEGDVVSQITWQRLGHAYSIVGPLTGSALPQIAAALSDRLPATGTDPGAGRQLAAPAAEGADDADTAPAPQAPADTAPEVSPPDAPSDDGETAPEPESPTQSRRLAPARSHLIDRV